MLRPRDPRVVPAAAQSRFRQRMILPGANSTDSLLLTQEGKTMISWDFFSVANNLGDSVAFNLESDIDVWMPETSGLEVQARLHEVSADTKVIVMTGRETPAIRAAAPEGGVF